MAARTPRRAPDHGRKRPSGLARQPPGRGDGAVGRAAQGHLRIRVGGPRGGTRRPGRPGPPLRRRRRLRTAAAPAIHADARAPRRGDPPPGRRRGRPRHALPRARTRRALGRLTPAPPPDSLGPVRTRGPQWEDAPAVAALLVARHTADVGLPLFRVEEVHDEWRSPDVDLSRDALLVQIDGALAGYAIVNRVGAFAVVAPEYEGRGVGARLLEWVERREREREVDVHRQIAASTNARARELLKTAGYRQIRSYWRMACPLDHRAPAVDPPAGVTLRPLDPAADAKALYALDAD